MVLVFVVRFQLLVVKSNARRRDGKEDGFEVVENSMGRVEC